MVGGGVSGSNPYDYMELVRRTPQGSVWTYQGIMRFELPINTMSIVLGQHVRCGVEDNLWGRKGERATTLQQIETLKGIADRLGRKIASGDDARRIMKIGTWYDTVEETLFNLGLPPNRPEGQPGFLVYDTGGRIPQVAGSTDIDPRQIL
jgi:beta-keto acid cleavage enzyme